jgi:hypothetical protein
MYCNEKDTCTYMAKDIAEWLTIGKMIEILGDEIAEISPTWDNDDKIIRWAVDVCNANYGGWFSSEELCDALWEAVKKVLQGGVVKP